MKKSVVNFANWINAQGNMKVKISQAELRDEYNRIRRNLERSIRKYQARGLDTSFFQLPPRPSRITEGSIRRLKDKVDEWRYLTDQKITRDNIPSNWQKTSEKAVDFRIQNTKWLQERRLEKLEREAIEQKRAEIERANKDNPYYKQALEEGYSFADLVTDGENYALKILQIAKDALDPEGSTKNRYHLQSKRKYNRQKEYKFNKNQEALFNVVKRKASLAIKQFMTMGIPYDTEAVGRYSDNLQQNFFEVATEFEQWLWASDQWSNPSLSGLELVVKWMTKDKRTSGKRKRELGNMVQEEDI